MVLGKLKYFAISVKYIMFYVYNNDSLTMCELCFEYHFWRILYDEYIFSDMSEGEIVYS